MEPKKFQRFFWAGSHRSIITSLLKSAHSYRRGMTFRRSSVGVWMNLLLDPSVLRPILLLHVFSTILVRTALAQPSSVAIGTTFNPDISSRLLASAGENLFSLELRIWPDSATRYCMCGVQYRKKEGSANIWSFSADQQPVEGSTCELVLSTDGELSLYNDPGHAVWTSRTAGLGVQNMTLREDGNLVLTDGAGNTVWQSFTAFDSIFILPSGMNFTRNMMLFEAVGVPRSPSFSTPGEHALVLSASGHLHLVLVELMYVYHSFNPSGVNASLVDHVAVGDAIEYYFDASPSSSSSGAIATVPSNRGQGLDPSFPRRLGFVMEGNFVINYWNGSKNVRYYNSSVDLCYMPKSCRGHYKLCSSNDGNNITCKCPPGFQANSSGDCNPRNYKHNMKPVNVAFHPQMSSRRVASQDECGALCSADASCNAALFDASASSCSLFPVLYTIPEAPRGPETPKLLQVLLLKVPKPRPLSTAAIAAAAAASAALFFLALLLLSLVVIRRRRRRRESADEHFLHDLPRLPPRFTYRELRAATHDFCKKLGEGGFGAVYEGDLSTGVKIAVKRLDEGGGGGGGSSSSSREQFEAEVGTIGSVSHVNLVRLRGFCMEGKRRLLVYEFMARGSLDRWLFKKKQKKKKKKKKKANGDGDGDGDGDVVANGDVDGDGDAVANGDGDVVANGDFDGDGDVVANGDFDGDGDVVLDWATRCRIALDTARGLEYLHHQCAPDHIVHCDIKPENILLDHDFNAKVADFGLAKLIHNQHHGFMMTTLKGTRGYLAPEWLQETSITPKSDVYSYGVVLLELITGRRCLDPDMGYLPTWALRVARSSSSSQTASDFLLPSTIDYSGCLNASSPPNRPTSCLMGYDVERVEDIVLDDRLDRKSVGVVSFERLFTLALGCVRTDPATRPSMASVVQILEGELVDWWKPDWPAAVSEPGPVATPLAIQSRALLHSTLWRNDDFAPASPAYPYPSSTLQVTGPR